MDKSPFNNVEEFLNLFDIDKSIYTKPVILSDIRIGFSIQRNYPEDIRYKPPQNKENKDDTVALIHVVYTHPSEFKGNFDFKKVPIIIRIGPHSRYLSNHFDYNFDDDNSPTEQSLTESKSTPKPIALDYLDEIFFSHQEKFFFDNRNNKFAGSQLLEKIFEEHCNTVHLLKGFKFRSQIRLKSIIIMIISWVISSLPYILKKLFGRTIEEENLSLASVFEGYKDSDLKKLSTDSLNIFGYKASRSLIVTFCFLVFIFYLIQYIFPFLPKYIGKIFSTNFLAITHAILFLWVLDVIIPRILFRLLNLLIRIRKKLFYIGL